MAKSRKQNAKPPVLQEHFLRLALTELGINGGTISVDHHKGQSTHDAIGTVPLVFPISYIEQIAAISKAKSQDVFFQGVISDKRAWLRSYENVTESRYGRVADTKYTFHADYYAGLCRSRFALAPTGDCPWSYRFFEGIMCHAIPVLGDADEDVFAAPFVHLRHSQPKTYDPADCEANYAAFLRLHTLPGLGFMKMPGLAMG
jgi:Exostosin family